MLLAQGAPACFLATPGGARSDVYPETLYDDLFVAAARFLGGRAEWVVVDRDGGVLESEWFEAPAEAVAARGTPRPRRERRRVVGRVERVAGGCILHVRVRVEAYAGASGGGRWVRARDDAELAGRLLGDVRSYLLKHRGEPPAPGPQEEA